MLRQRRRFLRLIHCRNRFIFRRCHHLRLYRKLCRGRSLDGLLTWRDFRLAFRF